MTHDRLLHRDGRFYYDEPARLSPPAQPWVAHFMPGAVLNMLGARPPKGHPTSQIQIFMGERLSAPAPEYHRLFFTVEVWVVFRHRMQIVSSANARVIVIFTARLRGPDVFRFRHQLFTSTENDAPCRQTSTHRKLPYPDAQRLSGYTASHL